MIASKLPVTACMTDRHGAWECGGRRLSPISKLMAPALCVWRGSGGRHLPRFPRRGRRGREERGEKERYARRVYTARDMYATCMSGGVVCVRTLGLYRLPPPVARTGVLAAPAHRLRRRARRRRRPAHEQSCGGRVNPRRRPDQQPTPVYHWRERVIRRRLRQRRAARRGPALPLRPARGPRSATPRQHGHLHHDAIQCLVDGGARAGLARRARRPRHRLPEGRLQRRA